jgi:hypothetical protein
MNIDQLKTDWKNLRPENTAIRQQPIIKKGSNHLNAIKLRLAIEMLSYVLFLAVYYTMFDGDRKPLYANLLLVGSFIMVIIHNLTGYLAATNILSGDDILQSMTKYHRKLKVYAIVCLLTRTVSLICLLIFFVSSVELDTKKNWILAGLCLLVPIQAYINHKIWFARIRRIGDCIENWHS